MAILSTPNNCKEMKLSRPWRRHPFASVDTHFETVRYDSSGTITQYRKKPKNFRKNRVFEASKSAQAENIWNLFTWPERAFSCGSLFEVLNCLGEIGLEKNSRNFYKCRGMSGFGEKKTQAQLPLRNGFEQTTSLREPKRNGFIKSAPKHPQLHEVRQNTLSSQKNSQKNPNFRFLFAIFSTTNDRRIMKLSLKSSEKTSSCVGWY